MYLLSFKIFLLYNLFKLFIIIYIIMDQILPCIKVLKKPEILSYSKANNDM